MVLLKIICFVSLTYLTIAASSADKACKGGAVCIALDSCSLLIDGLKKGNSILLQLVQTLHCGFETYNLPKVCCPPEFQLDINVSSRFGDDLKTDSLSSVSLLPNFEMCGIQNNYRIYRQARTEINEHPWTVLLGYKKPHGWGFHCGGVLISSKYVMTAASCVNGPDLPSDWNLNYVRLGEWNISSTKDCYAGVCSEPHLDVPVEDIIVHENYEPTNDNQFNDIALLMLAHDVRFTEFIRPICLPLTDELKSKTFAKYEMLVAGWGETGSRSESGVKLKTNVTVVEASTCSESYQWIGMRISSQQMCAVTKKGTNAKTHRRDSGGALMSRVTSKGNWIAVGVASYGPMFYRAATEWPSVYTRVGPYVDWIARNLKP